MRKFYIIPLLVIMLGFTSANAEDNNICDGSDPAYLSLTGATGSSAVTFKKICLPNPNNRSQRLKNLNMKGGVYQIGNQVVCALDDSLGLPAGTCVNPDDYRNANSSCADSGYTDGCQNNDFKGSTGRKLGYADYDGDPSSTTSSEADLTLKSNDQVIWAKLYWMGRRSNSTNANTSKNASIRISTPTSGGYQTVTPTHKSRIGSNYYASAEINTAWVSQSGQYWVADVLGRINKDNQFAAWALVVVYKNDAAAFTNISLYEGFGVFYNNDFTTTLKGFLTPDEGTVTSSFHVFAGESDNGYGDSLKINDIAISNQTSGTSDFLNATISRYGNIVGNRIPNFPNALGIDIDSVDSGYAMSINQTEAAIKFHSSGDQLYTPFMGFTTQLYVPDLCYDYSYKQDGRYFTEDNNGSINVTPSISGIVTPNNPVNVNIYVRNNEGTARVENPVLYVDGLDANGELKYNGNMKRTDPGGTFYNVHTPSLSSDAGFTSALADSSSSVPFMAYRRGVYTSFDVMPSKMNLSTPLKMTMDFKLKFDSGTELYYSGYNLKDDIPLCTGANFAYNPEWGIYNVVDRALYNSNKKYNLFTQVVDRDFNVDLISLKANAAGKFVDEKKVFDMVGVEMYDAGGFHEVNVSCSDPDNAISDRYWLPIVNKKDSDVKKSKKEQINIKKLTNKWHYNANVKSVEFNSQANENTAFRTWFFVDKNGDKAEIKYTGFGADNKPLVDMDSVNSLDSDGKCSSQCSSFSTNCMECLKRNYARPVCSRDNFAIRPESYNIIITDPLTPSTAIGNDVTNNMFSAGYDYNFDINATTHKGDKNAQGYKLGFSDTDLVSEKNVSFTWNNLSKLNKCNDTSAQYVNMSFLNGAILGQKRDNRNVGEYLFSIVDNYWTRVDRDNGRYLGHHKGANSSYFMSGSDCVEDSSIVSKTYNNNNYTANKVGCMISSSHTNNETTKVYTNKALDFKVDHYDLPLVMYGANYTDVDSYMYMNDIENGSNKGVATHFKGRLSPKNAKGSETNNSIDGCYANALDIHTHTTFTASASDTTRPNYKMHLVELDDTNRSFDIGYNNADVDTNRLIAIDTTSNIRAKGFSKGGVLLDISLNFDRNISSAYNPKSIEYGDMNVTCSIAKNCKSISHGKPSYLAKGIKDYNRTINYYYARAHSPDYRFNGLTGTGATYYEIYCDNNCEKTFLPTSSKLKAPQSAFWYIHADHNISKFGVVNSAAQKHGVTHVTPSAVVDAGSGTGSANIAYTYDNAGGSPYRVGMSLDVSDFLIYNKFDITATKNDYTLEFINNKGNWAGKDNSKVQTDNVGTNNTNRRTRW